jgi:hypothetical protein
MKLLIPRMAGVIVILGWAASGSLPLAADLPTPAEQSEQAPAPAPPPPPAPAQPARPEAAPPPPAPPQATPPQAAVPAPSPPQAEPGPGAAPQAPKTPAVRPSEAPAPPHTLVGLHVFSSDGTRLGEVRSVATGANGEIAALHIRTGGFLGFGGRIVAIPDGKFIRSGQSIRLDLSADEVNGLPSVKE